MMEGFEKEDLEPLRPYLTVYPDFPFMNLNTVKPLILKSLLDYLSGDAGIKQVFLARFEETLQKEYFFRSSDLQPEIFSRRLKLPPNPVMRALAQQFLSHVTADSETFSIIIKTRNQRQANGVFRYREGQSRPKVLAWHEE